MRICGNNVGGRIVDVTPRGNIGTIRWTHSRSLTGFLYSVIVSGRGLILFLDTRI